MAFITFAAFGALFFAASAAYALARRGEIHAGDRVPLAGAHALPALLVAAALALEPAATRLAAALPMALALALTALALGRLRARGASALTGAALLAGAAAGALGLAEDAPTAASAGALALAGATVLAVGPAARAPWERAAAQAWVPAGATVGGVSALRIASEPTWGPGVATAGLALVAVGLALAPRRGVGALPFAILAPAVAVSAALGGLVGAGLLETGWLVLPLVFAPASVTLAAFLRGRAPGAASRPFVATALAYAVNVAFLRLAPAAEASGRILALALGAATLVLLETRFPELDEARSRAAALARPEPARAAPRSAEGGEAPLAPGGRVLARYRIVEALGEGGSGVAYLAEDEVGGGRVVVKALHPERAGDPAFLREAKAMAAVRNSSVVELKDVVDEAEAAYLVMEHVEGGSLASRLARGPLTPGEFARVARGVLTALEAVHHAGLVHGDVKPSNVLLTREGDAKLADFGVSRRRGVDATLATRALSIPAGTLRYMSPEQARGRPATAASDLYSAAATLYESLSGKPWVEAAPNETAVELQVRVARLPRFDRPIGGPPALRAWFERALEPEPEGRFASAAQARLALEAALQRS